MLVSECEPTRLHLNPRVFVLPIIRAGAVVGKECPAVEAVNHNASHAAGEIHVAADMVQRRVCRIIRVNCEIDINFGDCSMLVPAAATARTQQNANTKSRQHFFMENYFLFCFFSAFLQMTFPTIVWLSRVVTCTSAV